MLRCILLVDDDQLIREAVKRLLKEERDVYLAEAGDGAEAVRIAQELHFDVVLMDIAMPRMDGLEATRRIKAVQPQTKVVILTAHEEEPYRKAARESGADVFIAKKRMVSEVIPMIRV